MTERSLTQEKISAIIDWLVRVMVIISIFAFFLPYVSCSAGITKVSVSSAELSVGAEKEIEISFFGYSDSGTVPLDPQPSLFILLILPIVAGVMSLLKKPIAKSLAYLVEGIAFLLFNNHVLQTMRSQLSYGNYDLSRYTLNLEIGYKLYLVHSWAMILLGVAGIAGWYYLSPPKRTDAVSLPDSNSSSRMVPKPTSYTYSEIESSPSFSEKTRTVSNSVPNNETEPISSYSATLISTIRTNEKRSDEKKHDGSASKQKKDTSNTPFSPPTGF